jgi:putative membrane protein
MEETMSTAYGMDGMDGMGGMGGGMMMWMLLWGLVGLALIALAVVGIVWLVRRTGENRSVPPPTQETPQDVLKRRYAAGEIEEEEYLRRQAGLEP